MTKMTIFETHYLIELNLRDITDAALKIGKDIYTGNSHLEALEKAEKALRMDMVDILDRLKPEEGFVTKSGEFLTRAEVKRFGHSGVSGGRGGRVA